MPIPEKTTSFAETRKKILSQSGKEYWRSVEEYADSPEWEDRIKGEFPLEVENWDDSLSRRNFIKVMGASLALAGLSGCVIQPPEKIVPYVRQPEDVLPGKPLFFATSMTLGGTALPTFTPKEHFSGCMIPTGRRRSFTGVSRVVGRTS